ACRPPAAALRGRRPLHARAPVRATPRRGRRSGRLKSPPGRPIRRAEGSVPPQRGARRRAAARSPRRGPVAAINKRKLLESAQRQLQQGAGDKALADYQTVLQADPRDTNVRLKVGDLLQKAGRNEDAIAAYRKVADQFQRDGFDAKAVALYKQVTKIDGKRH